MKKHWGGSIVEWEKLADQETSNAKGYRAAGAHYEDTRRKALEVCALPAQSPWTREDDHEEVA